MHHNQFAAGPASPSSKKRSKLEFSQVGDQIERMSIDGTQKQRKLSDAQPSVRAKFREPIEQTKLSKRQEFAKGNLANGPEEK
jgi:hypothetical protein